ncbi:MAG: CDP-diacylglycerol--glycerol-3-phosphate 3-phosphatidyltransferase [Endozoicomonadaceae bacterium]|nr:CDP-diacylglycerol--glycerol-3-phosphate 3-phosphatidyltransferase [Endozoicomonadaceae bacterium]MCY4329356.1 CDP-diacylglycerol--glycerol-3-phosphate 3-phosphatidyltransferase [Endozoicomonadaceae bacterium]
MVCKFNIPNTLTFIRMILIPVIVIVFYLPWGKAYYLCAFIFFMACITDWLDGLLARKLGQMTQFGAFIDPVADKLVVAASLSMLIEGYHTVWITIPAMIIIGREIVISALREWMAEVGKSSNVAVNMIGKIKTLLQMAAILILFLSFPHFNWFTIVGIVALYIAGILTIWSMCLYLGIAFKMSKNS